MKKEKLYLIIGKYSTKKTSIINDLIGEILKIDLMLKLIKIQMKKITN